MMVIPQHQGEGGDDTDQNSPNYGDGSVTSCDELAYTEVLEMIKGLCFDRLVSLIFTAAMVVVLIVIASCTWYGQ